MDDLTSEFTEMLDSLGIEKGRWYETIVTTNGPHINAAAIGVRRVEGKLQMKIYEMSNTYENLQKGESDRDAFSFGINIICPAQIDLLCNAALKGWGSPIPEFPAESFEMVNDAPVLKDACVWVICKLAEQQIEEVKDSWGQSSRMDVIVHIKDIIIKKSENYRPITRGPDEPLVDALVYATKFKIAKGSMKDKCRSQVEDLIEKAGQPSDPGHTTTMEALKEFFGIID